MRGRGAWGGGWRGRRTVLLVTGQRLVRADFEGRPEPVLQGLWESAALSGAGMAELAEAAWLLGPRDRRRVHVLTEHVVSLSLSIPAGKVAGLGDLELSRALAFEAEAGSGIGPFDAVQGWMAQGVREGMRWYWVCQMPRAEVERTRALLAASGAELAGMAHPGGLPRRLGPGQAGWQRIELWEDRVVLVDGMVPQAPRIRFLDMPPSRSGWTALGTDWFQAHAGQRVTLAATTLLARHGPGAAMVLDDEEVLRGWLRAWAEELGSGVLRVPVLRPGRGDAARVGWHGVGMPGVAALAVVAACGLHAAWEGLRDGSLRRQLEEAGRPAAELAGHRRRGMELEAQLAEVRRDLRGLQDLRTYWKDTLDREHRRHASLLRVLGESMPEGVLLAGIEEGPGEVRVSGVSMTPDASGLGVRLGEVMESFGWRAEPPGRRSLGLMPGGGPWQVEWTLKIVAAPPGGPMAGLTNVATGLSREAARASVLAVGVPGRSGATGDGGPRRGGDGR